ncbi:hypothetical protein NA57DRAFT_74914 [Rhizodiscina lignyota]|uniref:Calcofluor white hypersensitive protein n=1 Tax=Rhizodiscina lignyota TaxID=1504668 RepID=A0A9P4MB61_9PEZI|nr:hypothetical protein NA57DRAFT_74914 [Rhizodiscina lignyota]
MSGRIWTFAGVAAAGGVGYYLYQAGGDPKVAQKKVEADASRISSEVKAQLPGKEKELQKNFEQRAQQAGQQVDKAFSDVKSQTQKADAKLEQYRADAEKKLEQARKDTGASLSSAVEKFDKNVQDGSAKTQSWIGSWFGGSKK